MSASLEAGPFDEEAACRRSRPRRRASRLPLSAPGSCSSETSSRRLRFARSRPGRSSSSACTGAARVASSTGRAAWPAAGAAWLLSSDEDALPDRGSPSCARCAAGASASRSGRARRTRSSTGRSAASPGCAPSSSAARGCRSAASGPSSRARRRSSRAPTGTPTSRSVARRRTTPTASTSRSSTTRPARTPTRRPSRPRSCGRSSSTTCRATAGTTSATTSSSTSTARSSKAATAGSRGRWSARTRRGSTAARSGSRVIGDYGSTSISPAARAALVSLIAWRLDLAHVDPLSKVVRVSAGNPRYAAGTAVTLNAISGHRDVYPTSCPGASLYAPAAVASHRGLEDRAAEALLAGRGRARSAGRSASPRGSRASVAWTVTVRDDAGATVASGTGTGSKVDWTWDATAATAQHYAWSITAPQMRAGDGLDRQRTDAARAAAAEGRAGRGDAERRRARRRGQGHVRLSTAATVTAEVDGPARQLGGDGLRRPALRGQAGPDLEPRRDSGRLRTGWC